jgi:para-nitrobenzyl esterase
MAQVPSRYFSPSNWIAASLALMAAPLLSASAFAGNNPTVKTAEGPVRGFTKNGVDIFLGIPYAKPPVGNLRWQPPAPVQHWRGALDATQYGNTCPQARADSFYWPSVSEDCLYLNVFTTGSKNSGKKPVIVWIHGGGNGGGHSDDYDGSKLATGSRDGVETIVVTFNYRMGLFGTFSNPAINSEGHLWGNYGTLDQQAVLRWVQRNIAAFGGDPTRVALGGQSAGAYDTGANILSPLSNGLFNRAIPQSTPGFFATLPDAASVLSKGKQFAEAAGCQGSGTVVSKCLRNLSTARILQIQGPYTSFLPFIDGTIIPRSPEQAWTTGRFNKMPILGGGTANEWTFGSSPLAADKYAAAVAPGASCIYCTGSVFPDGVAAQYPLSDFGGDARLAYAQARTDVSRCAEVHVAQKWAPQVPTYMYDFTYSDAPFYYPWTPDFKPLAAHTIDIQFLFDNFHGSPLGVNTDQTTGVPRELNQRETKLSDQLVAAWTNFAKTGNPNGSGSENSPWPRFTGSSGKYFVEDTPLSTKSVSQFRADHKCDFWDARSTY